MATCNLQHISIQVFNLFCLHTETDTWSKVMHVATFPHGNKALCLCLWNMTELHIQQVENF